jgi:hypothetical protein
MVCGAEELDVRFSNRPFGVKRFQTIHHYSVDVAHGPALSVPDPAYRHRLASTNNVNTEPP